MKRIRIFLRAVSIALVLAIGLTAYSPATVQTVTAEQSSFDSVAEETGSGFVTVSLSDTENTPQASTTENSDAALDDIFAALKNVIGFFVRGLNDIHIYLDTPNDSGKLPDKEIFVSYTENNGTKCTVGMGIYYNAEQKVVYGGNDAGVFDSSFNYDAGQHMFFNAENCWQGDMGFTIFYEMIAPLFGYAYITRRVCFNHDGKDWMIQLWKGNYGYCTFVGGEVGVYYKDENDPVLKKYNCATQDEYLRPITLRIYDANRSYVVRSEAEAWWVTGFAFADAVLPSNLTLESDIGFDDGAMLSAFTSTLDGMEGIEYKVSGDTVSLVW